MPTRRHFLQTTTALAAAVTAAPWLWQSAQAATWQRAWPGRTPIVSTQVEYSLLQRGVERGDVRADVRVPHDDARPGEAN